MPTALDKMLTLPREPQRCSSAPVRLERVLPALEPIFARAYRDGSRFYRHRRFFDDPAVAEEMLDNVSATYAAFVADSLVRAFDTAERPAKDATTEEGR